MDDEFVVIQWPDSQELMDLDGFNENCHLIDFDPLYSEYGDSAFFVRKSWLEEVCKDE